MIDPIDMSKGYHEPKSLKGKPIPDAGSTGGPDVAQVPHQMPTLGEARVGIKFNPSDDSMVYAIKAKAAELIDLISAINDDGNEPDHRNRPEVVDEVRRCRALAQTAIEDGAMWAVKAATKHLT